MSEHDDTAAAEAEAMYEALGHDALQQAKRDAKQFGVGIVLIAYAGNVMGVQCVEHQRISVSGTRVTIDASEVIQEHDHQVGVFGSEMYGPNGERIFVANITAEGDFSG